MTGTRRVALDSTTAWEAVRSAGGSIATAADALRITPRDLIEVLRSDRPIRFGLVANKMSGVRRRTADDDSEETS